MATQTENLNLTKPSYSETADIAVINGNMDIIDSSFKDLADDVDGIESYVKPAGSQASSIIDLVYPVGSIYMTMGDTTPDSLFPGTQWEIIADRFLYGVAASSTPGWRAGSSEVTLTAANIPGHTHDIYLGSNKAGSYSMAASSGNTAGGLVGTAYQTSSVSAKSTNEAAAHNNMPPYITTHIWERVA